MKLIINENSDEVEILCDGKIHVENTLELQKSISAASRSRPSRVVLDLSQVPFIDSSGLGMLLGLRRELGQRGCELVLRSPQEGVLAILKLTRLNTIFGIE